MKNLIPKCQKAWTALTYKSDTPSSNQDGVYLNESKAYRLPNSTTRIYTVPIQNNSIKSEPIDATLVVPNFSPNFSEFDSAKMTDAVNERNKQLFNTTYGVLRFIPYVKYATDFVDAFGLSPDQNGERDFTDASVWGKYGLNALANRQADLFNLRALYARLGMIYDPKFTLWNKATSRIKTPLGMMSTVRDPNIMNTAAQIFTGNALSMTKAVKYNPLGAINVIGDAWLEAKNLANTSKAFNEEEALADSLLKKYPLRFLPNGEPIRDDYDSTQYLIYLDLPGETPRAQLKRQRK